jgi:integrase
LRSFDQRKRHIEYWRTVFGADMLANVTPARISQERDRLLAEQTNRFALAPTGDSELDAKRPRRKRTGPAVNRYLAALSKCLAYARNELQWLEKNPCESVTKSKESPGRVRFLSDDERARLLAACKPHADLYLAVVLSLTTGARQMEIMCLRWSQVDFARRLITLRETKNGEVRAIPLVGEAFALLKDRAKIRSLNDDRIFPPTSRAKKSECLDLRAPWEAALRDAAITNFRWHDLRHTAASYLAMSGVSLVEIAKVLGHRTLQMVARYSHLSDSHIVATGEKLAARLGI